MNLPKGEGDRSVYTPQPCPPLPLPRYSGAAAKETIENIPLFPALP